MDALLLDFNGVIVDDEPIHKVAFRDILAEHDLSLDDATYNAAYLGVDDRTAFRKAFAAAGRALADDAVRGLVERKNRRYVALVERSLPVVPGVTAFVREAAARARIAIVSGALRREIEYGLSVAGLKGVVETIVSAEDVPGTKPDPAGFRLALSRLAGLRPAPAWRAAVIEDSLPGLAAARALGAGCAMLTTTHPAGALAGADLLWDTFEGHAPAELEPLWRPVEVRP